MLHCNLHTAHVGPDACEACKQEVRPPGSACNTQGLNCKAVCSLEPSEQHVTSEAVLNASALQPRQPEP